MYLQLTYERYKECSVRQRERTQIDSRAWINFSAVWYRKPEIIYANCCTVETLLHKDYTIYCIALCFLHWFIFQCFLINTHHIALTTITRNMVDRHIDHLCTLEKLLLFGLLTTDSQRWSSNIFDFVFVLNEEIKLLSSATSDVRISWAKPSVLTGDIQSWQPNVYLKEAVC